MIDTSREKLIPLAKVPEHVPGKKPNTSTVYRWALKGVQGVRLETLRVGGARLTSIEALDRFYRATTQAADAALSAPPTASDHARNAARQAAAEVELKRRGF